MELKSEREVEVTRRKLRILEDQYEAIRAKPATNEYVHELTQRSLQQTINQFKEDIARFQSRAAADPKGN